MTANEIADMVEKEPYHANLNKELIATFIRQQQAEIGCYKLELELHKAMIQDLEKVIKIKERDYNFMKDLAIGTEELLRKAQEK